MADKIKVIITEVLKREIDYIVDEGVQIDDVADRVNQQYRNQEIVLDSSDFESSDFDYIDMSKNNLS